MSSNLLEKVMLERLREAGEDISQKQHVESSIFRRQCLLLVLDRIHLMHISSLDFHERSEQRSARSPECPEMNHSVGCLWQWRKLHALHHCFCIATLTFSNSQLETIKSQNLASQYRPGTSMQPPSVAKSRESNCKGTTRPLELQ